MPYKKQEEFIQELASEFDINMDTFRCYTLESNPQIKVILFGKKEWHTYHVGFLINQHFHVLGLGSFSFINEDAKALFIALACGLPKEEQKLRISAYSLFDEEEQESIINKFKELFSEQ